MKNPIVPVIVLVLAWSTAWSLECPRMPEQTNKEWDVEVKSAVGKIGPVSGAELQSRTRSAVIDLMGKLPQADKVYFEQMMFASYCSAIRDDKSLKEAEKARLIKAYNAELRKALQGMPGERKTGKRKTGKRKTADADPEEARAMLSKLSIPFTAESFVQRVRENDIYAVKLLLAAGMNPNQESGYVYALEHAVEGGNREIVKALLDKGADVNRTHMSDDPALVRAARDGSIDILEMLLLHGASQESINRAVEKAADSGNADALRFLLKQPGIKPETLGEALRSAAGDFVSDEGRLNDCVRVLLESKVDPDTADQDGVTPLMKAAHSGRAAVVRTLLDAGADKNAICRCTLAWNDGSTALQMAVHENRPEVVKVLLERGVDLKAVNDKGETALKMAESRNDAEMVKLLTAAEAGK